MNTHSVKHSALYIGELRHRRFKPKIHAFTYRVFMVYLDLAELDDVLKISSWWSSRRFSPSRFKREDFHGDPKLSLDESVRRTVAEKLGRRPEGPIRVLANWRYFGFNMNPLTTYYCFDVKDEGVETIVAEVNNTPWNKRHAYVLPCSSSKAAQILSFDKTFHVSPFNPMDMQYRWRSRTPAETLFIHLENHRQEQKIFDASLHLKREPLNAHAMRKILIRFPWMTVKVIGAIYWEALKLWLKRVPHYGYPEKQTLAIVGEKKHEVH